MMKYHGYFIDLDGTVYRGRQQIPAARRFINRLQARKLPFLFVTNNTTKLPKDVVKNLAINHNIYVSPKNVYTAGLATADYLKAISNPDQRSVFIIGEKGLRQALSLKGFCFDRNHPDYVVVALDSHATYEDFAEATLAIQHGAKFIGTNPDTNIPNQRGMLPGAGSLVKMVEYATQTKPVIIGKPKSIILRNALKIIGLPKRQVIMVGDNYMTDISAGINFGMDTLLVYTGVSTPQQIAQKKIKPTYQLNSLDEWKF